MVQRWTATEGMEKDNTGDWMLFKEYEHEAPALSVENSLLRIERMKLREGLKEALDSWQQCLAEDHGEGIEVMGETDRIAELRKLLEPPSVFDDPIVVARGKAILEEAGRKLAEAVDRDYDERRKEGSKLLESCEHLERVNNRCVRCGTILHWSHGMESDAEGFDI